MTAYIRRGGGKKREQLERAEAELKRSVRRGDPRPRAEAAAERLRAANLKYIKAMLHELERPAGDSGEAWRAAYSEYVRAWNAWASMSLDEIISAVEVDDARS